VVKPLRERERYRLIGYAPAVSNGNYTFVYGAAGEVPSGTNGGIVINERTGARTTVPPPPCGSSWNGPVAGGTSVLFSCSQLEIYRIPDGPWRSLAINQTITNQCAEELGPGGCTLAAVGSDWVEFDDQCYHCGTSYLFENLTTGAVRSSPSKWGTYGQLLLDLNSPSLFRTICAPLAAPTDGELLAAGRYMIVENSARLYLERCGSSLQQHLAADVAAVAAAPGIVVWATYVDRQPVLRGMFLPSKRVFTVNLPRPLQRPLAFVDQITVTAEHLYVYGNQIGGYQQLWRAARPAPAVS
jgi:hypothetical protein